MANIVLIGFMGSGKSTIGSALARKMGRFLIDTDLLIESSTGECIAEIFAHSGEQGFRTLESQAIAWLSANVRNAIIATGGGMPIFNDISTLGEIYYLQSEFETILRRLDNTQRATRPLFSDESKARELYQARSQIYAKTAHYTINANAQIPEILTAILTHYDSKYLA
ncbi:shikimate kinase [uncultured Helicobacter sp.]|uniref:shikimate kinase n=1 Tax=uncultured Helicobacter sp. TaxID=175537 RepID=UPI001C3B1F8C|nr:shikimate kinase [Candidatus Helicobacter avicola]